MTIFDPYDNERQQMVYEQIERRGVSDDRVLVAMRRIPRHLFVPPDARPMAYNDHPVGIGHGQTVSQPYIVAVMTEALRLRPTDNVLEIGTGSGYQTAVLSGLVNEVFTVEMIPELGAAARKRLVRLGCRNVSYKIGDGYFGWPEHAPYDAVIVTAAPLSLPDALVEQLKNDGRLVLPVGDFVQQLLRITRHGSHVSTETLGAVQFVPMIKRKPP